MIIVLDLTCEDCIVRPACVEYEQGVQCSLLHDIEITKLVMQTMAKGFSNKFLEDINESLIFPNIHKNLSVTIVN